MLQRLSADLTATSWNNKELAMLQSLQQQAHDASLIQSAGTVATDIRTRIRRLSLAGVRSPLPAGSTGGAGTGGGADGAAGLIPLHRHTSESDLPTKHGQLNTIVELDC